MPLKLIPPRKGKSPNWTIKGSYLGKRVDRSSGVSKRALAAQVLKGIERQIERGEFADPHEQTFASAALSYMQAAGERTYVKRLLEHFGETPLRSIGQSEIDRAAFELYPNGAPATRNRSVYTPVCAILRRAGARVDLHRPSGSQGSSQTAWLREPQAHAIIDAAERIDKEFAALLIVLLYTGMRLGEALGLTWESVDLQGEHAYVPRTKNGDPRSVFLPPQTVVALANVPRHAHARVFRFTKSGYLYSLLRQTGKMAGVSLPRRSAFHIFRHTYATWMRLYANADDHTLIATGAWKDRKSVARYTHTIIDDEARKAALLPTRKKA